LSKGFLVGVVESTRKETAHIGVLAHWHRDQKHDAAYASRRDYFSPTNTTLFAFGSRKGAIEDIGNTWAAPYARGDPEACRYMDHRLCTLKPLTKFRASFEGATVRRILFPKNYLGIATFSNGVDVEFFGDGGTWTIIEVPVILNHG